MSNISEAVELVKQQARVFQAVVQVGAFLNEIRDLEQFAAETRGRCDAASKTLGDLQDEIKAASTQLASVKIKVMNAEGSRETALASVKAAGDKLIADAREEAARLLDNAKAQADNIHRDVTVARAVHNHTLTKYGEDEKAAQGRLDTLRDQIEAIKRSL